MRMQYKTIGEINHYASENVNPARFPEQYFELYSVPHFSEGYPEIIKGKDVGATKQVVQEGDVLICKINPRINRVWKVTRHTDYPLIASSEWVIVRNADLNADYLTYYFSSPKFRVLINSELTGMGGSLTRAQPKQIRRYSVPVPDKEEQHFVVRNLALLDHLISLRQRQAEKLDELVKARFVEMFGDPCEMLHWECKKIEEVADVTVGVVVKPANFYTDDRLHGVKAFRSLNIGEMKVKDNDWVYFSEEGNAQNAKSQLHEGDVLVVRSGAPGTSCVVTKAYEGCNAIDVIIVHVDGIKLNPYYLCAFNNFPHGMRQMLKGVGGAAQKHLNVGKYNQMIVAIPPMKLQNEFVLFMDSVDCEKDRIQRSAALLETLKRSLMQQYFG